MPISRNAAALVRELQRDFTFFGACGATVGWLMLIGYGLRQNGIGPVESWGDALFFDFVSANAFGLLFVGLLGLGALATCLSAAGIRYPKLERVVAQAEMRLTQLSSSVISFTSGLSAFCLVHAAVTATSSGVALAGAALVLNGLIAVGLVSASIVARRDPPFDRWWVGGAMLLLAVGTFIWFIVHGGK